MRGHRRALTLGTVALAAVVALTAAALSIARGPGRRQGAVLTRASKLTAAPGTVGGGLVLDGSALVARRAGTGRPLATLGGGDEVIAPVTGSLTPVAAASANGDFVVYSSWRQLAQPRPDARAQGLVTGQPVGLPGVRLFDLRSGKDELLATGAVAPAVSTTGAIAYLAGEGETVRQNEDYTGRVVVADSPDAKPRVWTSRPARYLPYAWAGSELLVYRGIPDSEGADLYAYSGPDDAHLLAPDAFAIAVSPDGDKVLVDAGMRTLEVISVADAAVEDSLSLDRAPAGSTAPPLTLTYGGSWLGDRIVANSDRGFVVLNVRGGLHVESVFATPDLPHGINEPVFEDDTHVKGWADVGRPQQSPGNVDEPAYENALVECDLATGSCAVGDANPARKWARWVTNPSR